MKKTSRSKDSWSPHLTVQGQVVQQLELGGPDVAEVDRLEQEEDELAAEVGTVESGGNAVPQAGHLDK